jgi:energy-coupling factor transporter ATP-binding protein EcfA2
MRFPLGENHNGKTSTGESQWENLYGKIAIWLGAGSATIMLSEGSQSMPGRILSPDSISSLMDLDDQTLGEELLVAYAVLRDPEKAMEAVARAAAQLPFSSAQQIDNRRRRYEPKSEARDSYRPLTGKRELFRFLLFDEMDELEIAEEGAGRLLTPEDQLRCYVKQIIKTVLNHNSFYAAVGMAEVLCDYSAQQTIEMYDLVTRSRAEHKDWAACSHARLTFLNNVVHRFNGRVELRKEGPAYKLNWRTPTATEVELVKCSLAHLLPPLFPPPTPTAGNGFLTRISPVLHESFTEMNRIYRFLHPQQFRELPALIPSGCAAEPFEDHLRVLDTGAPSPTDPNSDSNLDHREPHFDLDRLKELIKRYRNRRRRLAPGSLCIRVDGVDRGFIDIQNPACNVVLEEGASVVKLVVRDHEQESVTLATYVLTYDSAKAEHWQVDVPGAGQIRVKFDYRNDESVSASFGLRSELEDVYAAIGTREDDNNEKLTHEAIGANLEDNQRIVLVGGFGSGKTVFAQVIGELLKRAKDALIQLGSYPVVLRSRFSLRGNEDREREAAMILAQASYRKLRNRSTANKADEIDRLVDRQAAAFDEFLTQAQAHGVSIEPTPSVYERHATLSKMFGTLGILFGLCEGVALWFSEKLLGALGVSITSLSMILTTLASFAARGMRWRFSWSSRLYRRYYQAEHLIILLRADLDEDRIDYFTESGEVVDWRDLPLARTLGWLLRSRAPQQANKPSWFLGLRKSGITGPWIGNTISEAELSRVICELGEERRARRIARAIVRARPFTNTTHLAQALGRTFGLPDAVTKALEDSISGIPHPAGRSVLRRDGDRPA